MTKPESATATHRWQAEEAKLVLIAFGTPWSRPCRAQQPLLHEVARRYCGRLIVRTVDVDAHRTTAVNFAVHTVPTLVLQRGGKEVRRLIGLQSAESLYRVIERTLQSASAGDQPKKTDG